MTLVGRTIADSFECVRISGSCFNFTELFCDQRLDFGQSPAVKDQTTFQLKINQASKATLRIYDGKGNFVATAYSGYLAEFLKAVRNEGFATT